MPAWSAALDIFRANGRRRSPPGHRPAAASLTHQRREPRPILFCRELAVTEVVLVAVVVPQMGGVTLHDLHIRLVEHNAEKGIMDVRRGTKCMFDDVGRRTSP